MMIGVAGVIILFGMFFLEIQQLYDYQYAIEVRAQRAVNSTVEFSMDDIYRADGYNYMDIDTARVVLYENLREDLNLNLNNECVDANGKVLFSCDFGTPVYYSGQENATQNAGIALTITVRMHANLGSQFSFPYFTWTQTITSTNFRVDDGVHSAR